jgi:flagellar biosynthesis/type III secretory pathway protein FliH
MHLDAVRVHVLAALLVATGCAGGSSPPSAPAAGAAALSFGDVDTVSLGTVAVGDAVEAVVTVSNVGTRGLALGALASAELSAPFARAGGTCAAGAALAPGATCALVIRFAPPRPGAYAAEVRLDFTGGPGGTASAAMTVTAAGLLDCTRGAALQAGFDQGLADAENANTTAAAAAIVAGNALTYADGRNDGYHDGYVSTYQTAYDRQYAVSYQAAYDASRLAGNWDAATCTSGTNAGNAAGLAAGAVDGAAQGYRAAYDAAFAVSYATGYDAGFATSTSCASPAEGLAALAARARPVTLALTEALAVDPTLDASNVESCYALGRAQLYDPVSAYSTALAAAKAANVNYSAGYRDYYPIGITDGVNDGRANADVAGQRQGRLDGWKLGTEEGYQSCWQTAYPYGYSSGFSSSYASAFATGTADGRAAGYAAGFAAGRAAGCASPGS